MRLVTLGVGAADSPRYAPAGRLVARRGVRVMLDGGRVPRLPGGWMPGWERPIRFAGGVGGHLHVPAVAEAAHRHRVGRLVFAHIGRPTIRAIDRGEQPMFAQFARDGQMVRVTGRR